MKWRMLDDKLSLIYNKVKAKLETDCVYLDPKMSLTQLSRIIGTNTVYLSKAINEGYGKSFSDVINEYRIRYLLSQAKGRTDRLDILAGRCGFGSRSTFFDAFRRIMGMTPYQYMMETIKVDDTLDETKKANDRKKENITTTIVFN